MKKVIPFSNGTQAMIWMDRNCESCSPKCYFEKNMAMGFITGDITIKTAEFIGIDSINGKFVDLNRICNNKNKYKRKPKTKNHEMELF